MVKTNIIESLFFNILIASFLFPALGILLNYKNLKTEKVFIVLFIYCIGFMTMLYFDDFLSKYRHAYTTFYTTIEYLVFSYTLWFFIQSKKLKKVIVILSVTFLLFQATHYFIGDFSILDTIPIGVETILIFLQIFFLFYEQFQKATEHFYITPSFWIVLGLMIYLSGSFFFNILANNVDIRKTIIKYWFFTYIFEIIKNILFLIAIVIYAKKNKKNRLQRKTSIPYLDIDLT